MTTRVLPGVLEGLRAGRVAITASRNGPILLRHDGGFAAIGADGLLLADPEGPYRRIVGDVAQVPGRPGYHRLRHPAGRNRRANAVAARRNATVAGAIAGCRAGQAAVAR